MPLPGVPQKNGTTQAARDDGTVEAAAATAAPATDDVPSLAQSNPDLASLDEGWLDELFPGEEEEEEDEDEDDEPEPELPDERLDPEAFALAKKARDERAARKKEKKRQKAEAKRARQKARAEAMRQKQKAKKARASTASRRAPEPPSKKKKNERSAATAPKQPRRTEDDAVAEREEDAADLVAAGVPASKPRVKASAAQRQRPSTLASVKLLAIVLAILLALAAAVAAIMK